MSGNSRVGRRSPVERSGRSQDSEPSCSRPISGSKRSVQDRLGTREGDPSGGRSYKRLKGEYNQERHQSNDRHLAKGDLRLEIIKMRDQSTDLRVKLSSKSNIASADVNRNCIPENPRHNVENKSYNDNHVKFSTRKSMLGTRDIDVDERKNMEDSMPDFKGNSRGQCMWDFEERVRLQSVREVGDSVGRQGRTDVVGRQSLGEHKDTYNTERPIMQGSRDSYSGAKRQNIHEPWGNYNGGDPNILNTGDGYDSGRQRVLDSPSAGHAGPSYPSLALDIPIHSAPVRMLSSTIVRASSPDRNLAQQRKTMRQYDDERSQLYRSHEVPGPYMPVHMRPPPLNALPPLTVAPAPFPAQFPQPILRNQNPAGQPPIDGFLRSIGLEKYSYHFHQEEVDFHALAQMTDNDLKELKIPMGPRKRILQALLPPPPRR